MNAANCLVVRSLFRGPGTELLAIALSCLRRLEEILNLYFTGG